ncbi:hypothetical protein MmTuc01_1082 [Methanosarcina mazei Tuc01]|uniref:Uncharacterized protein n=1 Tax=Methanosarcina mazei Tuc01 TaxID=1236903 RepID=M1Q2K2_METMZ|nr:hypothetical protein MmTuc01_1082 [Methanosarcina mazei Tuc01]
MKRLVKKSKKGVRKSPDAAKVSASPNTASLNYAPPSI